MRTLPQDEWRLLEAEHGRRVAAAVGSHLGRRRDGRPHPVEDFLFTYYSYRPGQLRRWHPGAAVRLAGAADTERAGWAFYGDDGDGVSLDLEKFVAQRGETLRSVRALLAATARRPRQLDCFGLHEWAMVYRQQPGDVRHAAWPLRLGPRGTDAVVEGLPLRCTHVDAFRFFTPPARPLNSLHPTRETQVVMEQPGCLHAGMDLYKWAFKLAPATSSELVLDAFLLAKEIRELDMRASPYDLRDLGYEPVRIETAEGRAEYVRAQRSFAERADLVRSRLLAVCDDLTGRRPGVGAV